MSEEKKKKIVIKKKNKPIKIRLKKKNEEEGEEIEKDKKSSESTTTSTNRTNSDNNNRRSNYRDNNRDNQGSDRRSNYSRGNNSGGNYQGRRDRNSSDNNNNRGSGSYNNSKKDGYSSSNSNRGGFNKRRGDKDSSGGGFRRGKDGGDTRGQGQGPKKKIIVKKTERTVSDFAGKDKDSNKKAAKIDWKKKKQKEYLDRQKEKAFSLHKKKKQEAAIPEQIEIADTVLVKDLAKLMNLKVGDLIKKLMGLGYMATINDALDQETAEIVAGEFGCTVKVHSIYDELEALEGEKEDSKEDLIVRPPVVTVMGHVDHGKTTLLDYIRTTNVVAKESGGITQHIASYQAEIAKGKITFIDTPGHAAFTQMRERGAAATDIVILVVAADDGMMPQTIEAISHSKAAEVPIIVAVNKMDKEGANPDVVKQQLSEKGLIPEEWGGETIFAPVSALRGDGVEQLLESVLLIAEMQELRANPKKKAKATILEAKVDKSKGSTATLIVKDGTLHKGDFFVAGVEIGKVRAIYDHNGKQVKSAGPSAPVEVIGFNALPEAGDILQVVETEKRAKEIATKRKEIKHIEHARKVSKNKTSLDDLYQKMQDGQKIDFNIIVKADVQGTAEAIKNMVEKLSAQIEEVNLKVIHSSVGAITENDILLASTSEAIIVGFNVRPNNEKANQLAKEKGIEIRKYSVIYEIIDDIKSAVEGLLAPEEKEVVLGMLKVRDTFKVPKIGVIAGCYVTDGKVTRSSRVRVLRDGVVIHDGKISSLKRFQDDAKEVLKGYECGLGVENFKDLKVDDQIESYEIKEIAKKLELKEVSTDKKEEANEEAQS